MKTQSSHKYYLWDWLARICHVGFIASFIVAQVTAENHDLQDVHVISGQFLTFFLITRVTWGFIGPKHLRFSKMIPSISSIKAHLASLFKRSPSIHKGHTALGGLMALVLLTLILAQILTGLAMSDENFVYEGPLLQSVGEQASSIISEIHDILGHAMIPLVILHVAAAIFYLLWKNDAVILSIFSGYAKVPATKAGKSAAKPAPQQKQQAPEVPDLQFAPVWLAIIVPAAAAAVTWWIFRGTML